MRKITFPVIFRLLYSSGIRTTEVRLLLRENVDLQNGILDIKYSKGPNQHYVVLHDSMLGIMRRYDETASELVPGRIYFFSTVSNGHYSADWVTYHFKKLWKRANSSDVTPYQLRHNYAIENINSWVGKGFDFYDKFVFLSKSMGHVTLESTKYYYSIVPALSQILEEKDKESSDWILPEVPTDEESN